MSTPHSSYWLGKYWQLHFPRVGTPEYAMRMSSLRRSVADFVKIVTKKDIPVKFSSGQQSYTDGNAVVISAVTDPAEIDVMVGLALHEASHVLLSQDLFRFLQGTWAGYILPATMNQKNRANSGSNTIKSMSDLVGPVMTVIDGRFPGGFIPVARERMMFEMVTGFMGLMYNFLEDRVIDLWMYDNIGGYRPYYDALYDKYFLSSEIDRGFANPQMSIPMMQSYEFHIINMMNPNANPKALPGLEKIHRLIDLKNIRRLDDKRWTLPTSEMLLLSRDVAMEVFQYVLLDGATQTSQSQSGQGSPSESNDSDESDDELENLDGAGAGSSGSDSNDSGKSKEIEELRVDEDGNVTADGKKITPGKSKNGKAKPMTVKDSEENRKALEKILQKQKDFITGKDQDKNSLDAYSQSVMDQLEASRAVAMNVGEEINIKANTILYREVSETTVKSSLFPFGGQGVSIGTKNAVTSGWRMGDLLAHRIRVLQDEYAMKFSRQLHGKLDKKRVNALGYGADSVFANDHIVRMQPVFVHLTIDASGSMSGERWNNAIKLATALARASAKIRTMDVVISIRAGTHGNTIGIAVVYDSRRDDVSKIKKVFPHLHTSGSTPEGLAYEALMKEFILTEKNARKFFINISDGEPAFSNYYGESAVRHTRNQVNKIRRNGAKVLSYFVGNSGAHDFRAMYGKDAAFISADSILDIARTLNRLFLQDDE